MTAINDHEFVVFSATFTSLDTLGAVVVVARVVGVTEVDAEPEEAAALNVLVPMLAFDGVEWAKNIGCKADVDGMTI